MIILLIALSFIHLDYNMSETSGKYPAQFPRFRDDFIKCFDSVRHDVKLGEAENSHNKENSSFIIKIVSNSFFANQQIDYYSLRS